MFNKYFSGRSTDANGKLRNLLLLVVLCVAITSCSNGKAVDYGDESCQSKSVVAFLGRFDLPESSHPQPSQIGAELAVQEFNEQFPECQIILKTYVGTDGVDGVTRAAKEIVQSEALGVISANLSGDVQTTAPIFERGKISNITPTASRTDLVNNGWKYFHRTIGTNQNLGSGTSRFISSYLQPEKIAIYSDGSPYGVDLAERVRDTLDVSPTIFGVTASSSDIEASIKSLSEFDDKTVVYFAGHESQTAEFLNAMRSSNIRANFVGASTLPNPLFFEKASQNSDGVFSVCLCVPLTEIPQGKVFEAKMKKINESIDPSLGNAVETYDAMSLLLKEILVTKDDREEINRAVSRSTSSGIARTLSFNSIGESANTDVWVNVASQKRFVPLTKIDLSQPMQVDVKAERVNITALPNQTSSFRNVGQDSETTYGVGSLEGRGTLFGEETSIQLQATVEYVNGTGPFSGFWTFTFADGEELAFRYKGRAVKTQAESIIAGNVEVIGGTGRFKKAKGMGVVFGRRKLDVGSAVNYGFELIVER